MKRKSAGTAKPLRAKVKTHRTNNAKAPTKADAIAALVAANASALGLSIDPAWHGGVKFNLQLILSLAAMVDEFPLPDNTEPAPVFRA